MSHQFNLALDKPSVFLLTNKLGLYNTCWGVILIPILFQLGFCTFVLRNFMRTIPGHIMAAGRIDEATIESHAVFNKLANAPGGARPLS